MSTLTVLMRLRRELCRITLRRQRQFHARIVQVAIETGGFDSFLPAISDYRQIQSTCVGNQPSRALSSLPAIIRNMWRQSLKLLVAQRGILGDRVFLLRYVRNQLMLLQVGVWKKGSCGVCSCEHQQVKSCRASSSHRTGLQTGT